MLTYLDNSRLKYMENMFEGPPGSIAVWLIFKKYIKFALEIALTIISPSLVLSMPKILVFATCYSLATKATAYWIKALSHRGSILHETCNAILHLRDVN